tara:strand:+ start:68 stop:427 length:360 start_codon:yes stop_codon:yes gene_type:complete
MITGDSKISLSNFDMPANSDGVNHENTFASVPTYSDVVANQPSYCFQCVFGGGEWTPRKAYKDLTETKYHDAKCKFPNYQTITHTDAVSVDGSLTYKQLFDGLAVCGIDASSVGFGNAD